MNSMITPPDELINSQIEHYISQRNEWLETIRLADGIIEEEQETLAKRLREYLGLDNKDTVKVFPQNIKINTKNYDKIKKKLDNLKHEHYYTAKINDYYHINIYLRS